MLVESKYITIFPCVSRNYKHDAEVNMNAKLMSEENITNIIKSIADKSSYVIDYVNSDKKFRFILNGYYIEYEGELNGDKYAQLKYQSSTKHILIEGETADGEKFGGLEITNQAPQGDYLCLCKDGKIPVESLRKFNHKSIGFDFGELN